VHQVIRVTVYIKESSLIHKGGNTNRQEMRKALFSRLLGCWYDIFPFKLSELTNGMSAKLIPIHEQRRTISFSRTGLIPDKLSLQQRKEFFKQYRNKDGINSYNEEVEKVSKHFSFNASDCSDDCGVVANSDVSFAGTLKRVVSCCLVDDFHQKLSNYQYHNYLGMSSIIDLFGLASNHRNVRCSNSVAFDHYGLRPSHGLTSYLDPSEIGIVDNLRDGLRNIRRRCTTMAGLLQQLENVGHKPAEHVDGLNVELFDFQREAVGWALEREQEGGVETFLWTKLPEKCLQITADTKCPVPVQMYYSPVLDLFRLDAPPDVRGGLIAAQMGLG